MAMAAPDPDRRVHADQGAHAVPPHLGRPLLPRRQYRRRRDEHGGYHGTNSAIGPSRLAKRPLDQRKTVSGGRVGCFSPKFARGSHRARICASSSKPYLMVVLGRAPQRHMPSDLGLLTRASRAAAPSSSLAGSSLRLEQATCPGNAVCLDFMQGPVGSSEMQIPLNYLAGLTVPIITAPVSTAISRPASMPDSIVAADVSGSPFTLFASDSVPPAGSAWGVWPHSRRS